MSDLTIKDLGILLNKRGLKLALHYSDGQAHAYAYAAETTPTPALSAYGRGDDLSEALESLVEKIH